MGEYISITLIMMAYKRGKPNRDFDLILEFEENVFTLFF